MSNSLRVTLITPEQTIYDGEAVSVSSKNKTGPFDILLHHENFISIIFGEVKVRQMDGKVISLPIDQAVLMATGDVVKVFTGLRK